MKNDQHILDTIVRVCSILVCVLGFLLMVYLLLGPYLGLLDAESAGFGVLLAGLIIILGIVSIILSLTGHAKAGAIVIIVFVLLLIFNIWKEQGSSSPGIPTTAGGLRLTNQPLPPAPHPLTQ